MLFENLGNKTWGELTAMQQEIVMQYAKISSLKDGVCKLACPENIEIIARIDNGEISIADNEYFKIAIKEFSKDVAIKKRRKTYEAKNNIKAKAFRLNEEIIDNFVTLCLDRNLSQAAIVEQCMIGFCDNPIVSQERLKDLKTGLKKLKSFKIHQEVLDRYLQTCNEKNINAPLQLSILLDDYVFFARTE